MNHEELMKKLDTVICNLNDDGLALMYYFIGDMHDEYWEKSSDGYYYYKKVLKNRKGL